MGSPAFAVPSLRALMDAGHDLALIVTRPPHTAGRGRRLTEPDVGIAAHELGLSVYQPERFRRPDAVERLQREHPDAIVIAAYGQILPRAVLDLPPLGCINVHPSLLPRHRGPSPIPAAILAGDDTTGASIMVLDEGMDSGPVLAQTTLPIDAEDDAQTLAPRLAEVGARLLETTLPRWAAGE